MKENTSSCSCSHKEAKEFSGESISKVKKSCCNEETVVLSNTNVLNTVKSEIPCYSLMVLHYISYGLLENSINQFSSVYSGLPEQIPKADIPVFTSSLLI